MLAVATVTAATADAQDASTVRPAEAVAPIAPELPAAVLADLEESRFDAAASALEPLARDGARSADDRAFLGWIRGIALRRAGKLDAAATALREAMTAAPGSVWTGKVRGELAAVELARRDPAGAERLARDQVEALLSPARKDRLAAIVEGFARRLLEPGDPLVPADPGSAYQLFHLAHGIARGDATRGRLLLAMARASRAGGNLQQAASDLEAYLNQHRHASDRARVGYELAEVQQQNGQHTAARNRWTDLARQLEGPAKTDPAMRDLRARCLYQIGRSYLDEMRVGAEVARLRAGLAVAALRRFLAAEPGHELAVEAAYQIAQALEKGGQSQPALDAFRAFLEGQGSRAETPQARRRLAELTPPATFQVGAILQAQGKLDEALAAYRRYTERFPGGPQLADAQRAILDVELAIADEHDRRGRHEQARAAREAFVARNPLDPRVPLALLRNGRSLLAEGQVDRAIAAWEALIARFPDDASTARPHWEIARVYEERRADPARAIEHLRRVQADPWMARARERIAVLESRTLAVVTPRTYRSGEVPALRITTRNINSLSFAAYRLDAEDYFRKKHRLDGVESLAIDLVAPEHAWTETIPGAAKYVPVERTVPLKPINAPGAWVVKIGDDATIHAVTLVLVTDVQAIVKASRDQVLVLAQDPATGKGRAGATVLAANPAGIVLAGHTGPDGVLLANWPKPMAQMARLEYLVLDGPHVAATGLTLSDSVAQGLSPRALIYTDRPAYRPGQRARIRGILRDVKDGRFDPGAGATYRLEVLDSRGRRIVGQTVALSPFGTFHAEVPLDAAAPVGTYRIRVFRPGGGDFGGIPAGPPRRWRRCPAPLGPQGSPAAIAAHGQERRHGRRHDGGRVHVEPIGSRANRPIQPLAQGTTSMPRQYDPTTKDILYRDPPAWMSYMQLSAAGRPIEVVDADLSTVPSEADRAPSPRQGAIGRSRGASAPRTRTAAPHTESSRQTLPAATPRDGVAAGRVTRWRGDQGLPGGPGADATRLRPDAHFVDCRDRLEPPSLARTPRNGNALSPIGKRSRIMASTLILAGMRLTPDVVDTLKRRLRTMNILKDSSFYQVLLKEGKELGMEEGLRLGQLKEARKLLIRQGRIRFGRLPNPTRAVIEAIDDLERLEQLSERILTATSWDDLLAGATA